MKFSTGISAIALTLCSLGATAITRSPKTEVSHSLNTFNSIVKELQTFYVDSIDIKKSVETAIEVMLDDIDPYTEYIPSEGKEDFKAMTTGEYAGVGSYIMSRNGNVYFSEPSEGSPAQLAGIKAGDLILMIDGDSVKGWDTSKVSSTLKGRAGTDVSVTVQRPYDTDSIKRFLITRKKIQMPSVPYYGVVNGNLGYIALNSFTEKSPSEVKEALMALKADPAVSGIVLDLRGNGGGLLESAVQIVNLFVPKGTEVLRTRGKEVTQEKIYKTTANPVDTKIPLVVLIDGGSASSSEIVAGSLQDLDRAVIVGTRSFGKGLVQTTRSLPHDGMLKVTIAKYYIPSGRLIQAIDYSRRNPDGSVSRIPDSLTNVFHTARGREVRDGGGITPDIAISYPEINRLTYQIVSDNWAFDYGTRYAASHASIPSPSEFEITDEIYADFKSTIDPKRFDYDKVCETMLSKLREAAEKEGYMNDSVKAEFTRLEGMLKHDLDHDLDLSRAALSPYLSSEIIKRYYFNRGAVENSLKYDVMIDSVSSLLKNPAEYNKILSAPKK